uniref:Uncharacterized protein n=1 Tax=Arundo donax TaxID=35708 RepID=A0A0A9BAL6_ARUDO
MTLGLHSKLFQHKH